MSVVASGASGNVTTHFNINSETVNAAGNATTYTWSVSQSMSGGTWTGSAYSISASVNGNNYSGTTTWPSSWGSTWHDVLSGTTTVPHNADGTKSFSVSFSTGALPGTSYGKATSGSGTVTATNIGPGTPTISVGTVAQTSVALSWARASGYSTPSTYYRQIATNSGFTSIFTEGASSAGSQTYTGLQPGTRYYARVRSQNASGNSGWSGVVNFLTIPATPAAPSLTSPSSGKIAVAWSASASATGYDLQYATSSAFTSATTVAVTSTSATLDLAAGTTYYVRVRSKNATGASGFSAAASRLTLPGNVATLTVASGTPGEIEVSWVAPTGTVTGYDVEYATDSAFTDGTTVASTGTSVTLSLTAGETYFVRVRAKNGTGPGLWSAAASTQTLAGGRRWTGDAWSPTSTAKRWDGTQWVQLTTVKRWDGTDWVNVT